MSVSKWAYHPAKCDGDFCLGECDLCPKKDEEPSELDRLEDYLKGKGIKYKRFDVHEEYESEELKGLTFVMDRHQICVPDAGEELEWDAICHEGSCGYKEGLLEIYGTIVREDEEVVVGNLTAEDVIERIEHEVHE